MEYTMDTGRDLGSVTSS